MDVRVGTSVRGRGAWLRSPRRLDELVHAYVCGSAAFLCLCVRLYIDIYICMIFREGILATLSRSGVLQPVCGRMCVWWLICLGCGLPAGIHANVSMGVFFVMDV